MKSGLSLQLPIYKTGACLQVSFSANRLEDNRGRHCSIVCDNIERRLGSS